MIVEERIYTLHAGKVPDLVKLYAEEGLPLQQRYLGKFIGYFTTETGNLNQVVFMWASTASTTAPPGARRWRRTLRGRLTAGRSSRSSSRRKTGSSSRRRSRRSGSDGV